MVHRSLWMGSEMLSQLTVLWVLQVLCCLVRPMPFNRSEFPYDFPIDEKFASQRPGNCTLSDRTSGDSVE
jgi:hypothetical protein